jgi:TonB-dependent SusC/RagA subfamily outer membrane receptor
MNFRSKKEIFLSFTVFLFFHLFSFALSGNPDLNAAGRLKNYFTTYDPEKAYVQFDKPYYAAGDTIYFKAYVTEGERHQLSGLNEVLHVELINPDNKIDQSINLWLHEGVSWGDFALSDSLPRGNYRVRAYTQWMRNRGQTDFFERSIPIGSLLEGDKTASKVFQQSDESNEEADIQFFPEGGSLVTGINTKVAFKAIGPSGLSIFVRGIVIDSENIEVCSFTSAHLGMGYFFLNPAYGETYRASVTFGDSSRATVDLPKQEISGISLSVNNDQSSMVSFIITVNAAYYNINRNKDFSIVIYSGGKSVSYPFKQDVDIITFDLERRLLQTGVATVTLFSQEGEPLCERLFFVQNNDQLGLHIEADTTTFKTRQEMRLVFDAKNKFDSSVAGHFSVSVTDESKVPEDENEVRNILTVLLLTSSLVGYVEQPDYYFIKTNVDVSKYLDILLLTQGYRSFEWKQVLDTNNVALAYQHETGLEINGRITNQFGKPISNGKVTLIPSNGGQVLSRESNDKGLFKFSGLIFAGTIHFVLSALNSKDKNSTEITYSKDMDEPPILAKPKMDSSIFNDTGMVVYLENTKEIREDFTRDDATKYKVLKEVKVKKQNANSPYRTQSLAGASHADQVMHADEIKQIDGQLGVSLNWRLIGVQFKHNDLTVPNDVPGTGDYPYLISPPGDVPMLVVIDGSVANRTDRFGYLQPVDIDDIASSQVETIEVLKYASASIYGMGGGNGVLVITTKQGDENEDHSTPNGILSIAPAGFYKARTFYSPKYDPANLNSPLSDLRSTIYWNHEIQTGKDGKASFDYFNADGTGTYKVTIEGIDIKGKVGRLVHRYEVK